MPQDRPTIRAAIDAASKGDEVVISAGVFTGPGNRDIYVRKPITVRSENGPQGCIIDCEGNGRGFDFPEGVRRNTVLRGVTIRNGNGGGPPSGGGAIRCVGAVHGVPAMLRIERSSFVLNYATASGGALVLDGGTVELDACHFALNEAVSVAGAIDVSDVNLNIEDSTFLRNGTYSSAGALNTARGDTVIANSLFAENWSVGDGGAIRYAEGPVAISSTTIVANAAIDGGGISQRSGSLTLSDSILWRNRPDQVDGALTARFSNVQGGWPGEGNIDADPLFVQGPLGAYYLSQRASGQADDSPCVDAGSDTAKRLGLDVYTTRTDQLGDEGIVDMGYHAPLLVGSVECGQVKRMKVGCKDRRDRFVVKATVATRLDEGDAVTLSLDGLRAERASVNGRGRAKAAFSPVAPGTHEICIAECPGLCDTTDCGG